MESTRLPEDARELEIIRDEIESHDSAPSLPGPNAFSSILLGYCMALERAVHALAEVSAKLARKASAEAPYRWSEYQKDMDEFKRLESEYMEHGRQLNRFFGK